jgi:hypothetical protein
MFDMWWTEVLDLASWLSIKNMTRRGGVVVAAVLMGEKW